MGSTPHSIQAEATGVSFLYEVDRFTKFVLFAILFLQGIFPIGVV